jgi:hypothetical protein
VFIFLYGLVTICVSIAMDKLHHGCGVLEATDEVQKRYKGVTYAAGGGSVSEINFLLFRGYQVMAKNYSSQRAQKLAAGVSEWVDDPRIEGRQVGCVRATTSAYERAVRRIAVRCRKKNGQWGIGVLISTLSAADVLALIGQSPSKEEDDAAVLLAYASFYDARGGGVEMAIKDDKQGLGITKRNKKRFEAQQMVMLLNELAHNVSCGVAAKHLLGVQKVAIRRSGCGGVYLSAAQGLRITQPSGYFGPIGQSAHALFHRAHR